METDLIPGRFWGVFFVIMTTTFISYTYLVVKGMLGRRIRWIGIITFISLPYFIITMLRDEQMTTGEKIIDSIIASVAVVSGIVYIYVLRKTKPPDELEKKDK